MLVAELLCRLCELVCVGVCVFYCYNLKTPHYGVQMSNNLQLKSVLYLLLYLVVCVHVRQGGLVSQFCECLQYRRILSNQGGILLADCCYLGC